MEIPKGHYVFGTVKVGERGQIIIPKEARETFDIKEMGNRCHKVGCSAEVCCRCVCKDCREQ